MQQKGTKWELEVTQKEAPERFSGEEKERSGLGWRVPSEGDSSPAGRTQKRTGSPPAMQRLRLAVLLACLGGALAAEESCEGHCDKGFEALRKCQCDDLCMYYQSCCSDYLAVCRPKVTRGDVFVQPEDDYGDYDLPSTMSPEPTGSVQEVVTSTLQEYSDSWADYSDPWTEEPLAWPAEGTETPFSAQSEAPSSLPELEEEEGEEEEVLCSGKPFDAFTSVKNGSIFAFRGKYVYELDEKSALPGYPKLIQEVWGIEGPVDAAFTRINCEGKTYIFQGDKYWRFADGVLEEGFPRNISDGFKGVPDDLDAAFAVPAQNYFSSERVYFFKGRRYWTYDFANQPTREDCEKTSPSLVFDHYAVLQDDSWESIFHALFGGARRSGASRPRYISRDWQGIPGQLDAVMLGRIYVAQPAAKRRSWKKSSRRNRKKYHRKQRWGLWSQSAWNTDHSSESDDLDWLFGGSTPCQPFQSVYFFVGDEYYRLNLRTRRVDTVYPRYPRPIAKYWLGCPADEDLA